MLPGSGPAMPTDAMLRVAATAEEAANAILEEWKALGAAGGHPRDGAALAPGPALRRRAAICHHPAGAGATPAATWAVRA